LLRDIHERPERARRKERIASAPKDSHRRTLLGAELLDERCFADTRLASEENQATTTFSEDDVQRVAQ
jgi:hypothetical protein